MIHEETHGADGDVSIRAEFLYFEDLGEALVERGPGWRRIGALVQVRCFYRGAEIANHEGPIVLFQPA